MSQLVLCIRLTILRADIILFSISFLSAGNILWSKETSQSTKLPTTTPVTMSDPKSLLQRQAGLEARTDGDIEEDELGFLFTLTKVKNAVATYTGDDAEEIKELAQEAEQFLRKAMQDLKVHKELRMAYGGFNVSAVRKYAKDLRKRASERVLDTVMDEGLKGVSLKDFKVGTGGEMTSALTK